MTGDRVSRTVNPPRFVAMARTVIRGVARIVPEPGACLERARPC